MNSIMETAFLVGVASGALVLLCLIAPQTIRECRALFAADRSAEDLAEVLYLASRTSSKSWTQISPEVRAWYQRAAAELVVEISDRVLMVSFDERRRSAAVTAIAEHRRVQ